MNKIRRYLKDKSLAFVYLMIGASVFSVAFILDVPVMIVVMMASTLATDNAKSWGDYTVPYVYTVYLIGMLVPIIFFAIGAFIGGYNMKINLDYYTNRRYTLYNLVFMAILIYVFINTIGSIDNVLDALRNK